MDHHLYVTLKSPTNLILYYTKSQPISDSSNQEILILQLLPCLNMEKGDDLKWHMLNLI